MVRKIYVKQSVVIDLPTKDIFTYMSNLENLCKWSGIVTSVKIASPGAICIGTRVHSTLRLLGKWSEMTFEVVEYEVCRYMTLKSISSVSPCLVYYEFMPLESGGTALTQDTTITIIGGFAGMAERVVVNAIQRHLEHDLLTLKDVLETSDVLQDYKNTVYTNK